MKKIPLKVLPLLGVAAFIGSPASSSATLIISEQFDYAAGSLTGANGGFGFSGAWTTDGDPGLNISAGTYTNGLLPSAGIGNKATIDSSSTQASTRPFALPSGLGDEGSELWYSFLFQDGGSPSSSSDFSLFDTGTSGPVTLRITNDETLIRFGGTTLDTLAYESLGTETHLFVGRVTFSDTDLSDSHTVWMNPTGITGGMPTGGLTGGGGPGVKNVEDPENGHLTLQGGSAWLGSYDEIRLGTTLNDVMAIPEPSMAALFVGFGAGIFALVRRRVA